MSFCGNVVIPFMSCFLCCSTVVFQKHQTEKKKLGFIWFNSYFIEKTLWLSQDHIAIKL